MYAIDILLLHLLSLIQLVHIEIRLEIFSNCDTHTYRDSIHYPWNMGIPLV